MSKWVSSQGSTAAFITWTIQRRGGAIHGYSPLCVRAPPFARGYSFRLLKFFNLSSLLTGNCPPLYFWLLIGYDRKLPPPLYTRGGFAGTTIWRGTIVKRKFTKFFMVSPKFLKLLYDYIRVSEVKFSISLVRCRKWEPSSLSPRPPPPSQKTNLSKMNGHCLLNKFISEGNNWKHCMHLVITPNKLMENQSTPNI